MDKGLKGSCSQHSEQLVTKKIIRYAQDSWAYPLVSFAFNIWGGMLMFVSFIPQLMGIYCLIKTYRNIQSGRSGLMKHFVFGVLLNFCVIASYLLVVYNYYFID